MTDKLFLGRVLSFDRRPEGPGDEAALRYHADGAVLVRGGRIAAVGDRADIDAAEAEIFDHRPHLIVPGFIDTHLHFPQVQVLASWGRDLLDWLNTYTFPEETCYADAEHCDAMAKGFYDGLLRNGTTSAVAYGSVHATSAEAMFAEAEARGMCMIGGKVMMDVHAPPQLLDTPEQGYEESKALIARWHGRGRIRYAITPRFALTSTPAQLEAAGALCAEHPDCYMQTHVNENLAEIDRAAELYPEDHDYVGIYERFGLLSERALLGHAIHMKP